MRSRIKFCSFQRVFFGHPVEHERGGWARYGARDCLFFQLWQMRRAILVGQGNPDWHTTATHTGQPIPWLIVDHPLFWATAAHKHCPLRQRTIKDKDDNKKQAFVQILKVHIISWSRVWRSCRGKNSLCLEASFVIMLGSLLKCLLIQFLSAAYSKSFAKKSKMKKQKSTSDLCKLCFTVNEGLFTFVPKTLPALFLSLLFPFNWQCKTTQVSNASKLL